MNTETLEKKQLVKINPSEYGLSESKAQQIAAQFQPMLDKMAELEEEYNEIIKLPIESPATAALAKELRLKYVKVRTGTAEIHKTQKAFYLAGGRFVDGWKNAQLFASEGIEAKLESIEKYAANLEKERIAKLQSEREAQLSQYGVENISSLNLGAMTDAIWNNFLTGTKTNYEAKIEAERKAEADRIAKEKADRAEREAQRLENERLKKEAEEKEKLRIAEKAKADAILKAEREKADKLLEAQLAQAAKEKAIADAKLKAANEEREKLQREAKERQDAIDKADRERIAAEKKAAKAPDKVKLTAWVNSISINEITVSAPESIQVAATITEKFNAFKAWAKTQIETI